MKREEGGRGGGGVYANGLQDKKKTQLTGFKLAVAREARAQDYGGFRGVSLMRLFFVAGFCCCFFVDFTYVLRSWSG